MQNSIAKIPQKEIHNKLARKCSKVFSSSSTPKKCSIKSKKEEKNNKLEKLLKYKSSTNNKNNLKKAM